MAGDPGEKALWGLSPEHTQLALSRYIGEIQIQAEVADHAASQVSRFSDESWAERAGVGPLMIAATTLLSAGASISRYLFPTWGKANDPTRERRIERGRRLREELEIPAESPLRVRDLRNAIEHSDERLDQMMEESLARGDTWLYNVLMSTKDAVRVEFPGAQLVHMRSYTRDTTTLRMLDASLQLAPYANSIHALRHTATAWMDRATKRDAGDS